MYVGSIERLAYRRDYEDHSHNFCNHCSGIKMLVNMRTPYSTESIQVLHTSCGIFARLPETLHKETNMSAIESEQISRIICTNSMLIAETRLRKQHFLRPILVCSSDHSFPSSLTRTLPLSDCSVLKPLSRFDLMRWSVAVTW
jgi:hypothetical protein